MAVVSIRFAEDSVREALVVEAAAQQISISGLAERLIREGLRMDSHPLVVFRNGATGRRPALAGGPDVVEVIGAIVGGDVPATRRRTRAADLLDITESMVDAALAYYADFTDEVDSDLERRARLADEAELAWRRQQTLLRR